MKITKSNKKKDEYNTKQIKYRRKLHLTLLSLSFFGPMVSYLKNQHKTMKFKRRHGEFKQGCVLSQSYPATDTPAPILSACRYCQLACS
jgi:hypothetical protein